MAKVTKNVTSRHKKRLSHYAIKEKIGVGGMSIVYKGYDTRLNRPVAIKVLHPFLAQSPEYNKRFLREAKTIARLTHPNIVQIYDVSKNKKDSDLYLVTELISGKTLQELAQEINFKEHPELASMIIWQVLQALEHAHERGVIHRDIKPENIMITDLGQIKLMDFGIASLSNDENLTQSGTILGSLAHISPETIKGNEISYQSDIFSLSTVYYWLLANKLPFSSNTPHSLLRSIAEDKEQSLTTLSPFIIDEINEIVEKGMAKNKDLRFKSAYQMSQAIENALNFMGLHIDSKALSQVLKTKGITLHEFRKNALHCIEKKAHEYWKNGQEKNALSLACRLQADNIDNNFLTRHLANKKNTPLLIKLFFPLLILSALLILIFYYVQSSKKEINIAELTNKQKTSNINEKQTQIDLKSEITPLIHFPIKEKKLLKVKDLEPQNQSNKRKQKTKKTIPAPMKHKLELTIWPFANVFLNDEIIAKDAKSLDLKLKPDKYKLVFTHEYAATVERIVNLKDQKHKSLHIELTKSKPSYLMVNANINADIAVNGSYRGSTNKSLKKPILIPIPEKTYAIIREVIIQKRGYAPYIKKVKFIAGSAVTLNVVLNPLD